MPALPLVSCWPFLLILAHFLITRYRGRFQAFFGIAAGPDSTFASHDDAFDVRVQLFQLRRFFASRQYQRYFSSIFHGDGASQACRAPRHFFLSARAAPSFLAYFAIQS